MIIIELLVVLLVISVLCSFLKVRNWMWWLMLRVRFLLGLVGCSRLFLMVLFLWLWIICLVLGLLCSYLLKVSFSFFWLWLLMLVKFSMCVIVFFCG